MTFVPTEDEEQIALTDWLNHVQHTRPWFLYYAVPNGGWRNKITAVRLQQLGVKPGCPDIVVANAVESYHGLYIEMKRTVGGRLSERQKLFLEQLEKNGYRTAVCYGAREAYNVILRYFNLKPDDLPPLHVLKRG
jgi:hypothetical protein